MTNTDRIKCPNHNVVTEHHGISDGKKRYTPSVEKSIINFTKHLDNKSTAKLFGISEMTVYRIDQAGLSKLKEKYQENKPKPKSLSIDEVSYKRRHKYATVVSDYAKGKVLWLEKGRKQKDLERGFEAINTEEVEDVAMDLWRAYESATSKVLPQANIVYDRFHISRLLNRAIEKERRNYQKSLSDQDRKNMKKQSRWILLKRMPNLTNNNISHLNSLKETNTPLYEIYLLKESFLNIFDQKPTLEEAKNQLTEWLIEVFNSDYEYLKTFANSILKRIKIILNWFKYPISNGKAEGINNVIKTLLKRGYGYKNFDYFRLKVLQKCGVLMNYAVS